VVGGAGDAFGREVGGRAREEGEGEEGGVIGFWEFRGFAGVGWSA
jgi:hypothetical protein